MNTNKKILLFMIVLIFALISIAACDSGSQVVNNPETYNASVIIEGVVNADHAEFFSVLADGESGVDEFNYLDNSLAGDITGLSGTTELTLVIDNDNMTDGEYTVEDNLIEVDKNNNKVIFEVVFLEYNSDFAGGFGTKENPYLIETAEQLNKVRNYLDKHFKQIDNIDLIAFDNWEPIGDEDNPFSGSLDGNNKIITNLKINKTDENYLGLFNRISEESMIFNLGLQDVNISGNGYIGGITGRNYGEIVNSYVTGDIEVSGDYVGGITGRNDGNIISSYYIGNIIGNENHSIGGITGFNSGEIINSYTEGSVESYRYYVGGLVGINNNIISNSYSHSKVVAIDSVGGLVGRNAGKIDKSFSTGLVEQKSSENYHSGRAGGLVGDNWNAEIINSYSTSRVEGECENIGGLVGRNNSGEIFMSYSTGYVSGKANNIGGFIGNFFSGTIEYCFWDKSINNQLYGVGEPQGDANGNVVGKYSSEMNKETNFKNWDFNNVWAIEENETYPWLLWQGEPADFNENSSK